MRGLQVLGANGAAGNGVEQVALGAAEGDAVVAGLPFGQFSRARPLHPAQVSMGHEQALAGHALTVGNSTTWSSMAWLSLPADELITTQW